MTGPKLNEKSFVAGERSGTRASAMHVHSGAWKARVVLDLIRGLPVRQADEILQFTDRDVAIMVRKVLASAVANAQHNDEQDPEELYVKACYADEGPTMKRFTPRARGRAGRIKKRTCHITIVVDRLDDARLEVLQARDARRTAAGRRRGATTGGTAASRRERVQRSRQRAASLKSGDAVITDDNESAIADADDEIEHDVTDASTDQVSILDFEGSAAPDADGSAPDGFEIKGNADSMLYHVPGSRSYNQTVAEVYFDTVEHAEAAGFAAPGSSHEDVEKSEQPDEVGSEADDKEGN
jgi:large subunit ribosomal protein L22